MYFLFFTSGTLLVYTYVGYFLTVLLLGPVVRRLRRHHLADEKHTPFVSMIISLHNEEKLITQRIENFEALDSRRIGASYCWVMIVQTTTPGN